MIRLFVALLIATSLSGCWQKEIGRSYYPSGKVRPRHP